MPRHRRLERSRGVGQNRSVSPPHVATGAPPFRAEHIGSLLQASRASGGAPGGRERRDLGRRAPCRRRTRTSGMPSRLQEEVGLEVVTDGEYPARLYFGHFGEAVERLHGDGRRDELPRRGRRATAVPRRRRDRTPRPASRHRDRGVPVHPATHARGPRRSRCRARPPSTISGGVLACPTARTRTSRSSSRTSRPSTGPSSRPWPRSAPPTSSSTTCRSGSCATRSTGRGSRRRATIPRGCSTATSLW